MQVLADTSVWINHLRSPDPELQTYLEDGIVLMHPCVSGELALGTLKNRSEILRLFSKLPPTEIATNAEVLHLIEAKKLWGVGIGWVDAHLLAATLLTQHCHLWTHDVRLRQACDKAGSPVIRRPS